MLHYTVHRKVVQHRFCAECGNAVLRITVEEHF